MSTAVVLCERRSGIYSYGDHCIGISSKALKANYAENKYRFNEGTELQNQEFSDGSGLELYETAFRGYDPQIGRFGQIDPLSIESVFTSGYAYCGNNPVNFTDPSGATQVSQISDNEFSSPYLTPEFFGGSGGGGGYMDSQGNIWHGTDPFAGTAAQGIQYQEGYGLGGFGNVGQRGPITGVKKGVHNGQKGYFVTYIGVGAPGNGGEILQETINGQKFFAFGGNGDGTKDNPYNGFNILLATYFHFQFGGGKPFHVSTESLDFSNISQADLIQGMNGNISVNLFHLNNLNQTGLALGKVSLHDEGNNWYTIEPDNYDFNIERNNLVTIRNFATIVDFFLHAGLTSAMFGGPYTIYFHGAVYIKPEPILKNHP